MKKVLVCILLVPTLLTSCVDPAADLPSDTDIAAGLNQVLADTGFFTDAKISRFIGRHYLPGEDRWPPQGAALCPGAVGCQCQSVRDIPLAGDRQAWGATNEISAKAGIERLVPLCLP